LSPSFEVDGVRKFSQETAEKGIPFLTSCPLLERIGNGAVASCGFKRS